MGKEEVVEDDFHRDFQRRTNSMRRESGGSFWRASSSSGDLAAPSFSSVSMSSPQDIVASPIVHESRFNEKTGVVSLAKSLRELTITDVNGSSIVPNVSLSTFK